MPYAPSTQVESVGQTLTRSWDLYRSTFLKAFLMALVLAVIEFLPRIITIIVGHETFAITAHYNYYRLLIVFDDIICIIIFAAILWRMQNTALGRHESLKTDYRTGLKKLPAIIGASFIQLFLYALVSLSGIAIVLFLNRYGVSPDLGARHALALFLHGIPIMLQFFVNLFLFVLFYFYMALIITEANGPINSLEHSARLVWGRWWYTLWVIVTPWLIYTIVMLCFKALGVNLHIFIIEVPVYSMTVFPTLIHIILFAVFIPWFAATMLVQLRNLEYLHGPLVKSRVKPVAREGIIKKIKVKASKIKKRAPKKTRPRRK
jgi:hypothetical protein